MLETKYKLYIFSRPPDIVVNSAGITMDKYLLRMSEESFDKVIDVNLKGTFLINQITATAMKKADIKGSIVNISSLVGKTGNVGQTNYSASKAGVIAFTKTAAKELGKFGIRVNCICPGFIQTAMTDAVPEHVSIQFFFRNIDLQSSHFFLGLLVHTELVFCYQNCSDLVIEKNV